jgi:hypothetical protein
LAVLAIGEREQMSAIAGHRVSLSNG